MEREYIIPLRQEFLKAPRYRRTKRAITAIKNFLKKHMKVEEVKMGPHLNEFMQKHGKQNPPSRIKVKVLKEGNIARTELPGFPYQTAKKEEKKGKLETLKEKVTGKKEEKHEHTHEVKDTEKQKEIKEQEKILEEKGLPHKKEKTPEKLSAARDQGEKIRNTTIIKNPQKPSKEKTK